MTKIILTACLVLFLGMVVMTCQAEVKIVAHRGSSAAAPENTLASFKLAFKQNADAIEGDFYLSKDNKIVCIHDKNTKRVANKNLSVVKSTLAELQQLDVGSWKGQQWKGEKIATLNEVIATVPNGKEIFIEVKCGSEIVPFLKKQLSNSTLKPEQITIISFDKKVVTACKQQMPDIKCNWLTSFKKNKITQKWKPSLSVVLKTLKETGADGLGSNANIQVIDKKFTTVLKQSGVELHVWTVDDKKTARHFQTLGVLSITTNKPLKIRQALKKE